MRNVERNIMVLTDLHFGVIGWGYWGPKIARNLETLPHSMVTVVADSDARRLASLSVNQYQSWIFKTTRAEDVFSSDVDGVVIATPVRTHYHLAKEALLHGKHVLVEKPLTANVVEAEELISLAEKQRRVLMVGHTFEYSPAVNELRKLMQSGDLGKIYCIEMERVNLELFRSDINVIWDLAPHDVSILLYLLGKKPERIKVQAHAHLQPHIHDIAHLDLEFMDGMTAHIQVSWLHPCKIRRVTIIGDAGKTKSCDSNAGTPVLKACYVSYEKLSNSLVWTCGKRSISDPGDVFPQRIQGKCQSFAKSNDWFVTQKALS